jgi:hypothetical protein
VLGELGEEVEGSEHLVEAQALGDGKDQLPVRDGRADSFSGVQGGQEGALLVA